MTFLSKSGGKKASRRTHTFLHVIPALLFAISAANIFFSLFSLHSKAHKHPPACVVGKERKRAWSATLIIIIIVIHHQEQRNEKFCCITLLRSSHKRIYNRPSAFCSILFVELSWRFVNPIYYCCCWCFFADEFSAMSRMIDHWGEWM